jgi:hypothetical protein
MLSADNQKAVEFMPNDTYSKKNLYAIARKSRADINIVNIPKETLGFVNVGKYRISQSMEHMPLVRNIGINLISRPFVRHF